MCVCTFNQTKQTGNKQTSSSVTWWCRWEQKRQNIGIDAEVRKHLSKS